MSYDNNSTPSSAYHLFHMALVGYRIFYEGRELSKSDAFHLSNSEDIRKSIMERTNPRFEYVEKKDYRNGNYVGDRNTALTEIE